MKTYNLELNEEEILILSRALYGRRGMLYSSRQYLDKPEITATEEFKKHYDELIKRTDDLIGKIKPYVNYSPEVDFENNIPKSNGRS